MIIIDQDGGDGGGATINGVMMVYEFYRVGTTATLHNSKTSKLFD